MTTKAKLAALKKAIETLYQKTEEDPVEIFSCTPATNWVSDFKETYKGVPERVLTHTIKPTIKPYAITWANSDREARMNYTFVNGKGWIKKNQ